MAKIFLPQRSAVGPTRTGQAKPGFDLAGGDDLIQAGESIAKVGMFASRHFDDIRKAKTANEEAEGLGAFKGLVESFNTFSKANPNASPEQLRVEWGNVQSEINKLPAQIGTTSQSTENLMTIFANNMPLAEQKADSFAAAVGSSQQRARSEQQIKGLITDLDSDELVQHYMRQVGAGTYDKELIFGPEGKGGGRLDNELDIIETVKEKDRLRIEAEIAEVEYGNAQQDAFNAWRGTITDENPEGDINAGLESINKDPRIPNQDKQEAESELKARASSTMSQADEARKAAILESDNAIQKKINDKDTAGIVEFIRSQPALDEIQKGTWIDAVEKDAAAKLKDDEQNSPFNQGSNAVFQKWLNAAQTDPKSFDMNDMTELTKKPDGITTAQWRTINSVRNTALNNKETGQDPLSRPSSKKASAAISRVRALEIRIATKEAKPGEEVGVATNLETKYLGIENELNDWIELNKDDKDFEGKLEKKTKQLLTPVVETVTLSAMERLFSPKGKAAREAGEGIFGLSVLADVFLRSERQELAQERLQTLKKEINFGELSDEKQVEAKQALENGWTVQDVINAIEGF